MWMRSADERPIQRMGSGVARAARSRARQESRRAAVDARHRVHVPSRPARGERRRRTAVGRSSDATIINQASRPTCRGCLARARARRQRRRRPRAGRAARGQRGRRCRAARARGWLATGHSQVDGTNSCCSPILRPPPPRREYSSTPLDVVVADYLEAASPLRRRWRSGRRHMRPARARLSLGGRATSAAMRNDPASGGVRPRGAERATRAGEDAARRAAGAPPPAAPRVRVGHGTPRADRRALDQRGIGGCGEPCAAADDPRWRATICAAAIGAIEPPPDPPHPVDDVGVGVGGSGGVAAAE